MSARKSSTRDESAAEWFTALQSDMSLSEIRRWEEWISDPDNRASFDALASLWERARFIQPLPRASAEEIAADDYDGSVPFVEWSGGQGVDVEQPLELKNSIDSANEPEASARNSGVDRASSGRRLWVFAAAIVASVAIGWFLYPQITDEPRLYETGIAEHRTLHLSDGSEVLLGAETSLWVTYTQQRRTVVLDRGEVLIHVAPKRTWPFAVLAGKGVVTAVGTRFTVKRSSATERVTVTVTEGVVRVEPQVFDMPAAAPEIAPPSAPPKPRLVVAALNEGQRVSYDERGSLTVVKPVDLQGAVAWQEGRLFYRDESLREVIADVNRYSRREIVILDGSADALRYTGTVFQDDIDGWVDGLGDIFNLEVVEQDARHVVIRKRHAG